MALFVNSMAFVNNMVEVALGSREESSLFLCEKIVQSFIWSFAFPNYDFLLLMGSNDRPDQNQTRIGDL